MCRYFKRLLLSWSHDTQLLHSSCRASANQCKAVQAMKCIVFVILLQMSVTRGALMNVTSFSYEAPPPSGIKVRLLTPIAA